MRKKTRRVIEDDLRPEYDLSKLGPFVRGKHARQYAEGTNLMLIAPDVFEVFKDEESVNEALRLLIRVAHANVKPLRSLD